MTGGSTTNSLLSCDSTTKEMELTQEEKWSFTASPDTAPAGYYLRMYTCSVDVYAVVVYNPANDAAIVTTVLEEAAYSGSVGFYYSEDNTFDFGNPDELTFDASELSFKEPTKYYGGGVDPTPETTTVTVDLRALFTLNDEESVLDWGFEHGWFNADTKTLTIKINFNISISSIYGHSHQSTSVNSTLYYVTRSIFKLNEYLRDTSIRIEIIR